MMIAAIPAGIHSYETQRAVDTEAMLDASVSIRTVSQVTTDQFGDSVWTRGGGSGFLVAAEDCEVWTNHHVVDGAAIIEVFPRGWDRSNGIPARVVAATPRHDVAVLQMESCPGVHPIEFGDSHGARSGDDTYAVGNPLGNNPDSISRGIISHPERYVDGPTPYLQTDAAINRGNSGGALFDRAGRVIGMNAAIAATRSGANVGIGYATPINLVREVATALKRGEFAWGDGGLEGLLSPLNTDEARVFGVPTGKGAVNVVREPAQGPALGRLNARDVIFRVAGEPVEDVDDTLKALSAHRPGDVVPIHLVRQGEIVVVGLPLANGAQPTVSPQPETYAGYLGMTLEMWSDKTAPDQAFLNPVITGIQSLGPAHRSLISSSQHAAMMRGPFMVSFQHDVKTVTGVVYRGAYFPVVEIASLDRHAEKAAATGDPLLLEIELWRRENPRSSQGPLQRQGSAFYKITPALTSTPVAAPADDLYANLGRP